MDLTSVGVTSLVTVAVVDAIKDIFPKLGGSLTRLAALGVGGALGYAANAGWLPLEGLNIVSGAVAGAMAAGGVAISEKVGHGY